MMGVQGLSSFVKDNPQLLTNKTLNGCKLVIDGKNLCHFIYHKLKVNHLYGGDYDIYAARIQVFFNRLKSCNVAPYVVFDGGYETNSRKFQTVLKRLNEGVTRVANILQGEKEEVLPILAHKTFIHALDTLGIPHLTCDGEADHEIAALANHWNCPVLSNDSDFFVFKLKSGFVLLDSLVHIINKGVEYLEGKSFHYESLLRPVDSHYPEILPLFATLLGNDFVDRSQFKRFYDSQIYLFARQYDDFFKTGTHNKKVRLLRWLAGKKTFQTAMKDILQSFLIWNQNNIQQVILTSIKYYVDLNSTIVDYVLDLESDHQPTYSLFSYSGKALPNWFGDCLRKGKISTKLLDAIQLHKVVNKCQIENVSKPSSYKHSVGLRKKLYGILFSFENLPTATVTHDSESGMNFVQEFERQYRNTTIIKVVPAGGSKNIKLSDIPDIPMEERKQFILKCVKVSEIRKISEDSDTVLPLLAVIHWAETAADPEITGVHVIVMVACIFHFGVFPDMSDEKAKRTPSLEQFSGIATNYFRFDCNIVHAFSQYQTCLEALINLNNLVLCPFIDLPPRYIFSGTFAYNLFQELAWKEDPMQRMYELLGRSNEYSKVFKQMYSFVIKTLPDRFRLRQKKKEAKVKNYSVYDPKNPFSSLSKQ